MQELADHLAWLFTTHVVSVSLIGAIWVLSALLSLLLTLSLLQAAYIERYRSPDPVIRRYARRDVRQQWRWLGVYAGLLLLGIASLFAPTQRLTTAGILWGTGATLTLLLFMAAVVQDVHDRPVISQEEPSGRGG